MFKLLIVAYLAVHSSDNLTPAIAGSNWYEVGTFKTIGLCRDARSKIDATGADAIGGPNKGSAIVAVCVPAR